MRGSWEPVRGPLDSHVFVIRRRLFDNAGTFCDWMDAEGWVQWEWAGDDPHPAYVLLRLSRMPKTKNADTAGESLDSATISALPSKGEFDVL